MGRRPVRREPLPDINERLFRLKEVRVIGSDGAQLGVLDTREAVNRAQAEGLDLVLVAAQADPPVCRIVDYGKYKYELAKRTKDNKPKKQEVKGIKISPVIADHDLMVAVRSTIKFLEEGHKVRVVCRFRKKQLTHPEVGRARLMKLIERVEEIGKPDRDPVMSGMEMVVVINPKAIGSKKNAQGKTEDKQDSSEAVQDLGDGQDHSA
ncbi:MAG TPA: translation initiation factor IF-3 [Fimbriimonadaceae bacterium]|nr:translation initiation factor IF-3 [Armatimonadota bacterium]HCM74209.1 translation initiation factor IF-3 [Armatimonadota bacterium]HRD30289.1 translation initiation factor IF-3 [Fimbriimonadaceae bacterium]HRE94019.1 translation initiation factor IF-3 [Fimbriimonadaceae bacterium]HRI73471.1 translation initiation factor IF-3 [Fimbriimonadaceae bacterium]